MGKRATVAALLIGGLLSSPAHADGLTLTLGKFYTESRGVAHQVLSVKNGTTSPIEFLGLECGFLRGNQLIATGSHYLTNLQVGETGYQTVAAEVDGNAFPDHADCRVSVH